MQPKSDVVEVYLPVVVAINWRTGELDGRPEVDFDGAPWMNLQSDDNIWDPSDEGDWIRSETIEEMAINAIAKLLPKG